MDRPYSTETLDRGHKTILEQQVAEIMRLADEYAATYFDPEYREQYRSNVVAAVNKLAGL